MWKFDHKLLTKETSKRFFSLIKIFDVLSGLIIVQILFIVDYSRFS